MPEIALRPVLQDVIDEISDKRRMAEGIRACATRRGDFASEREMKLAGIAMVPEARQLMSDRLTAYWADRPGIGTVAVTDLSQREIIIGAGFHAAVYAANRVRAGFPRPLVLEQNGAKQTGGAFAVSLDPVFRLNSRNRPGATGLPDQDKALNYLPGGLIQPSMMTSEEYPTNADMAWTVRLALAEYADVYPGTAVAGLNAVGRDEKMTVKTAAGSFTAARVIDARGLGTEKSAGQADGDRVLTFGQLMARMGGDFPLRGMRQVAVIGAGDSGKCAVESLLGIAPGHSSAIGLDYVTRVDWYTNGTIDGRTCSEYRDSQRGRYLRIAQYLEGNVSNPSTRLRVIGTAGYPTPLPDGVIVNERTYDMAVLCTGSERPELGDNLGYFNIRQNAEGILTGSIRSANTGTVLAAKAEPLSSYRIGPAADLPFSDTETEAGVAQIPANQVAIFRLAPRTAALAALLPGLKKTS
jgi:hypothetical protein